MKQLCLQKARLFFNIVNGLSTPKKVFNNSANHFDHVDATDALLIGNSSIAASHKTISCSDRSRFSLPQPPPPLAQCQQSRVNQRSKTIEKKWNNTKNTTQQSFHRQLIWVAKSHALNSAHWLDSIFFCTFLLSLLVKLMLDLKTEKCDVRPLDFLSSFGFTRFCSFALALEDDVDDVDLHACACDWAEPCDIGKRFMIEPPAKSSIELDEQWRRRRRNMARNSEKWNEHVDDKLK